MMTGAKGSSANATIPLTRKSLGPCALAQQFEEEIESGRQQRHLVADAEGANAGIVPVDVLDVGGMLMVVPIIRRESFRIQPAPHIGNFSIRIVDSGVEQRPGRGFALSGVEQSRARIEFFQARANRAEDRCPPSEGRSW